MKRFTPTGDQRKTVDSMAAYDIAQAEIARHLGISVGTLRRHFRKELDGGMDRARMAAAQNNGVRI